MTVRRNQPLIVFPVFSMSITQTLPNFIVTNSYVDLIASLVGTVNETGFAYYGDVEFLGYDAGCVLYLGASGSQKEDTNWEVTHKFAIRKTIPETVIGSITIPDRPGWSYLAVEWKDKK